MLKFAHRRPEASPRHLRVSTDYYGSVSSLSKASDFRGSTNSISSSCSSANTSGTYRRALKKRRAPLPPTMRAADSAETLLDHSMVGGQQVREKGGRERERALEECC